jgi:hypothetical protein
MVGSPTSKAAAGYVSLVTKGVVEKAYTVGAQPRQNHLPRNG